MMAQLSQPWPNLSEKGWATSTPQISAPLSHAVLTVLTYFSIFEIIGKGGRIEPLRTLICRIEQCRLGRLGQTTINAAEIREKSWPILPLKRLGQRLGQARGGWADA
ncbi:hypothetical protein UFOVP407_46 [uncultured Caudovirales phage]|uniref:Uncharacterized protein n=1 Tax=uncultured Caudovirales phage TaxID=2100421 RepID=A0A6J5M0E9_9CAUD|nr:hypothetical protein UFOVP407_46 [uncultured Caudovirales phage]